MNWCSEVGRLIVGWLELARNPPCERGDCLPSQVRCAGWESTLKPAPLGGLKPALVFDARAERVALADPASRDIGPVLALRNELFLASISTIVVVAGQTRIHAVTVGTMHPTIVPPIVPGP